MRRCARQGMRSGSGSRSSTCRHRCGGSRCRCTQPTSRLAPTLTRPLAALQCSAVQCCHSTDRQTGGRLPCLHACMSLLVHSLAVGLPSVAKPTRSHHRNPLTSARVCNSSGAVSLQRGTVQHCRVPSLLVVLCCCEVSSSCIAARHAPAVLCELVCAERAADAERVQCVGDDQCGRSGGLARVARPLARRDQGGHAGRCHVAVLHDEHLARTRSTAQHTTLYCGVARVPIRSRVCGGL